jgi:hypothetical protein
MLIPVLGYSHGGLAASDFNASDMWQPLLLPCCRSDMSLVLDLTWKRQDTTAAKVKAHNSDVKARTHPLAA